MTWGTVGIFTHSTGIRLLIRGGVVTNPNISPWVGEAPRPDTRIINTCTCVCIYLILLKRKLVFGFSFKILVCFYRKLVVILINLTFYSIKSALNCYNVYFFTFNGLVGRVIFILDFSEAWAVVVKQVRSMTPVTIADFIIKLRL